MFSVEPSTQMIGRRSDGSRRVVRGVAGALPFADGSVDAAIAILTIHHWPDPAAGLAEMRRVSTDRIVLLTFDPGVRPWLTEYLPELARLDEAAMPRTEELERWLGPVDVSPVMIPRDCSDGFLYAYWSRPASYLDPRIRSGSSSFWKLSELDAGLRRLGQDLESGEWERRYGELLHRDELDVGYRLVVAGRR